MAADLGVSHTTVGRWIEGARRAETDHEKKVAGAAMEIAESIKHREAEARLALLDRLVAVASACEDNVQQVAGHCLRHPHRQGERGSGPTDQHLRALSR